MSNKNPVGHLDQIFQVPLSKPSYQSFFSFASGPSRSTTSFTKRWQRLLKELVASASHQANEWLLRSSPLGEMLYFMFSHASNSANGRSPTAHKLRRKSPAPGPTPSCSQGQLPAPGLGPGCGNARRTPGRCLEKPCRNQCETQKELKKKNVFFFRFFFFFFFFFNIIIYKRLNEKLYN